MRCHFCNYEDSKVIDSRSSSDGKIVRRRRECLSCARRFTTKEYIEESPLVVVKIDGRREVYDQEKLKRSLQIACKKRPVATASLDDLVGSIEGVLRDRFQEEVPSREIGEIVIKELRSLDEVAYVRFASVYRNFQDKEEFMSELEGLSSEESATQ